MRCFLLFKKVVYAVTLIPEYPSSGFTFYHIATAWRISCDEVRKNQMWSDSVEARSTLTNEWRLCLWKFAVKGMWHHRCIYYCLWRVPLWEVANSDVTDFIVRECVGCWSFLLADIRKHFWEYKILNTAQLYWGQVEQIHVSACFILHPNSYVCPLSYRPFV
jgi:hypothetical protein